MQYSLRYNTSQWGSPIPICYGTQRVSVNVLELFGFNHTGSGSGKGGIANASKGKSGGKQYSVNVAFGLCQGPTTISPNNLVYVNSSFQVVGAVPLNFYGGGDGQAGDPVFMAHGLAPVINYSGTAYATGTPLQLGNSPVLPNVSAEITGIGAGTCGPSLPEDANPAFILSDALSNSRYGVGYPASGPGALDPTDLANYGQYCQANFFGFSLLMDRQQPMSSWVDELAALSISAIFFSSGRLRVVPYSAIANSGNDAFFTPNLTVLYNLIDDDYLAPSGNSRAAGDPDPVIITRADITQLINWITIEIFDRFNFYDPSIQPPVFDQASIDLFGIRTGSTIQGHEVCTADMGQRIASEVLRRKLYLRNTYKFKVGWRYMLLEPMDIVTLTDSVSGLNQHEVRVIEIQEDEAGVLSITAEDIV